MQIAASNIDIAKCMCVSGCNACTDAVAQFNNAPNVEYEWNYIGVVSGYTHTHRSRDDMHNLPSPRMHYISLSLCGGSFVSNDVVLDDVCLWDDLLAHFVYYVCALLWCRHCTWLNPRLAEGGRLPMMKRVSFASSFYVSCALSVWTSCGVQCAYIYIWEMQCGQTSVIWTLGLHEVRSLCVCGADTRNRKWKFTSWWLPFAHWRTHTEDQIRLQIYETTFCLYVAFFFCSARVCVCACFDKAFHAVCLHFSFWSFWDAALLLFFCYFFAVLSLPRSNECSLFLLLSL